MSMLTGSESAKAFHTHAKQLVPDGSGTSCFVMNCGGAGNRTRVHRRLCRASTGVFPNDFLGSAGSPGRVGDKPSHVSFPHSPVA
jgi:hypothetical protein